MSLFAYAIIQIRPNEIKLFFFLKERPRCNGFQCALLALQDPQGGRSGNHKEEKGEPESSRVHSLGGGQFK